MLEHFLKGISTINYNKSKIDLLFVLNNSIDESELILKKFKSNNYTSYNKIEIKTMNFKKQPDDSRTLDRVKNYPYLSELRNYLVSLVSTDYLFSVDSDIIITDSNILNKLISHNKHIVSALICNGFERFPDKPFNCFNSGYFNIKNKYRSLTLNIIKRLLRDNKKLFESDLTGAIYLIKKEVYKNKYINYSPSVFGEDLSWCQCAKTQGYKLYTDITLYQHHIMNKKILQQYIDKKIEIPYDLKKYNLKEVSDENFICEHN